MTKPLKALLAVALAAALLIVAASVGLGVYSQSQNSYHGQLLRGQKYLEENDYENAVLCYRAAIQSDPDQPDGYIGLAQAYLGLGKTALAVGILEQGSQATESQRIGLLLASTLGAMQQDGGLEEKPKKDGSGVPQLNTALLDIIAGNTYDDYRRDLVFTGSESDGGRCIVETEEPGLLLTFFNTESDPNAVNPQTGQPYGTRRPNAVSLREIGSLFGAVPVTFAQLGDLPLDGLTLEESEEHGWVVVFRYGGCEGTVACDESGTVRAGAWNEFVPVGGQTSDENEPDEEDAADDNLTGRVINAQTGAPVSGVELEFLSYGRSVAQTESDFNGAYGASLEPGVYQVRVRCSGFVTEEIDVTVNLNATQQDLVISPELEVGEIRIVLEWGARPRDLDSYLSGTTDSGYTVSTSYSRRRSTGGGQVIAELDVDKTTGYGPETTTIYDPDGEYVFFVLDFLREGTMASSGATVKVYVGSQQPVVIPVAPDVVNGWSVCEIDHGEVRVINEPLN